MMNETFRLTQYSHGAGCGCKIAPAVLKEILAGSYAMPDNDKLIVGNHSGDDAAVYDLGNGTALISTTDFFMPVVDDPFTFGRIAAANAISDVYAMGGKPLLAIAILGWPVNKLPPHIAQKVIEGGRSICAEAAIPLAGGHSIDSPEPIFGLAVSGLAEIPHIKKNNTAEEGDYIFLTKAIGVGMLTTAGKRGKLLEGDVGLAESQMQKLNKTGYLLGELPSVTAMTDVTGFGLAGHLVEVADGSGATAEIEWSAIPFITKMDHYVTNRIYPDGTLRNWASYGNRVCIKSSVEMNDAYTLLSDPQTNGGLLFTVRPEGLAEVTELLKSEGLGAFTRPIGRIKSECENAVLVN